MKTGENLQQSTTPHPWMPLFRESMLPSSTLCPYRQNLQYNSGLSVTRQTKYHGENSVGVRKPRFKDQQHLGLRNDCCNIMMTAKSVYQTVKHNDDLEGTAKVIHACFTPAIELPRVIITHPGSHGSNHILGFVSRNDQKCLGGSAAVCLLQGSELWMCY